MRATSIGGHTNGSTTVGEEPMFLVGEPDYLDEIVAVLREFKNWPADDARDREFARQLVKATPNVDHITEARAWIVWMLDHEPKGKGVKLRARFINWCRIAAKRRGRRGQAAGVRTAGGRAGTRARTADEFGQTSDTVTGW